MLNRLIAVAAVSLLACFTLGCGSNDKFNRQAVSGSVNYKGKPLPAGRVIFVPAAGQQTQLDLEVVDGKFSTSKDKGLSPGKYTIKIQGFEGPVPKPTNDAPGATPPPMPKAINSGKYGEKSTESVEIKEGDKNELPAFTID